MELSHRALSKSWNRFSRFNPQFPELLVEVRDGSNCSNNIGEQLHSIHASSVESEGTIAFVSSRASSQCLRFVTNWRFLLGSGEVFFSGEPSLHCCPRSSSFHRFPVRAATFLFPQRQHPLPLPFTHPARPLHPPPPAVALPPRGSPPSPTLRRAWPTATPHAPMPTIRPPSPARARSASPIPPLATVRGRR
jgi:hypothetical protein